MCDLLVPFINNHHPTLQSLKLSFASFSPFTDISSHLTGANHLPYLRNLEIFDVSSNSDDSGLRRILEIHSDTLLGLCLDFGIEARTSRAEWYARTIFHVALPHLESLKLGAGCFLDLGLTAAYVPVQRFGNSLTTLTGSLSVMLESGCTCRANRSPKAVSHCHQSKSRVSGLAGNNAP